MADPERTRRPGSSTRLALYSCAVAVMLATAGCGDDDSESAHNAAPQGSLTAQQTSDIQAHADLNSNLVRLTNQARQRGVDATLISGHDGTTFRMPETVCGGAAFIDVDDDGALDIYVVQAGSLLGDNNQRGHRNQLFLNDSTGRFTDVTESSGTGDDGYGMGVATGDYDNDGDMDLYVTNLGRNVLYQNNGSGKFTDVTAQSNTGLSENDWHSAATFGDYDADGDLDLFVTRYIHWSLDGEKQCVNAFGRADYCTPKAYDAPTTDILLQNNGDGTFTDVSEHAGLNSTRGNGLGVICADFSGDGKLDFYVANDSNRNALWINQGDGTFHDRALVNGCAVDNDGRAKAGMGVSTADVDDDGDLDLLVVNLMNESDSFYRSHGSYFIEETAALGLAVSSRKHTRFGAAFVDLDNDGDFDLFHANGSVMQTARNDSDQSTDPYAEPNCYFIQNDAGRMDAVTLNNERFTSRGAAFGDVDNDGRTDVFVINRDAPASLLINESPQYNNWIGFDVRGQHFQPALHAEVYITVNGIERRRDVRTAYSYLCANDHRVTFGLGAHDTITSMRIVWPDGHQSDITPPTKLNEYHRIDRVHNP